MKREAKTVILGLDGACWEVLNHAFEKGWMPFFKRTVEQGASGTLKSTIPPMTCPAWPSILTGKNPAKHGLVNFIALDFPAYTMSPVSADDYLTKTYYERLSENGLRSVLINVTGTYPPKPINGAIITSLLTQDESRMFYPREIKGRYGLHDYEIIYLPGAHPEFSMEQHVNGIRAVLAKRFKAAKQLYAKEAWDNFFLVFSETDTLQHLAFTRILDDSAKEQGVIAAFFRELDDCLKWFVENKPSDDTTVLFISDHGFTKLNGFFAVNVWLREQGLLKTRIVEDSGGQLDHIAVARPHMKKRVIKSPWLSKIGRALLSNAASRELLRRVYPSVKKFLKAEVRLGFTTMTEFSETRAFCPNTDMMGVFVNDERFEGATVKNPAGVRALAAELTAKLSDLKNPWTGQPAMRSVWRRDAIYSGPALHKLPDVVFLLQRGWAGWTRLDAPVFEKLANPGADHDVDGIIVVHGKGVRAKKINATVFDVAPTILALHGLDASDDFDGTPVDVS